MNAESNYNMKTKLDRIAEMSKANPNQKFNCMIHHINPEMLKMCHKDMEVNKATGVDEIDKKMYEENLDANIDDLWERLKKFGYRPQPIKRVYIPKPGSEKKRPLGIPAYEDRLVQSAIAKLLNAIWEPIFMEYSYGFRPNRGCHQALGAVTYLLENKEIRYVVDVDIKGYSGDAFHNPESWFWSCNLGTGGVDSFGQAWVNKVAGTTWAFEGKSDYRYITYPKGYNALLPWYWPTRSTIKKARKKYGFILTGSNSNPRADEGAKEVKFTR